MHVFLKSEKGVIWYAGSLFICLVCVYPPLTVLLHHHNLSLFVCLRLFPRSLVIKHAHIAMSNHSKRFLRPRLFPLSGTPAAKSRRFSFPGPNRRRHACDHKHHDLGSGVNQCPDHSRSHPPCPCLPCPQDHRRFHGERSDIQRCCSSPGERRC